MTPAPGPAGRAAQAMGAAGFLARLPTFPPAKVDEIIDIREELQGPLVRFRGAMVKVAREFTAEPWERDFAGHCKMLGSRPFTPRYWRSKTESKATSHFSQFRQWRLPVSSALCRD
jgi:hypothetical protein